MVIDASESEFIISVVYERRADGGYRIYSEDVPGFILSHIDPALVFADVVPALETILASRLNKPVRVTLPGKISDENAPSKGIDIEREDKGVINYVAIAA